jgi:nucleolin
LKPVVVAKKSQPVQEDDSEDESEEAPKKVVAKVKSPVQKVAAKPAQKMVDEAEEDEEGHFEVCVKGISFQAFEDDIRALFEQCGEIGNLKVLMRPDGKPKGIAFVLFNKKSAFNKALELNETEQFGRQIYVEQAQGKSNNNDGGFKKPFNNDGGFNKATKFQGPQGNVEIQTPTLFIGGLSYNSTAESISEYFSEVGEVVRARIVTDRETGKVFLLLFSLEDSATLSLLMSKPLKMLTRP